jgi:hypothetical protein
MVEQKVTFMNLCYTAKRTMAPIVRIWMGHRKGRIIHGPPVVLSFVLSP